jgi:enoyl-CoA hydratase/carnithine racemase
MVEFQCEREVARIFLNRPQKVNALDCATLAALADALRAADGGGGATAGGGYKRGVGACGRRVIGAFGRAYTISRAKAAKEH